MIKSRCEEYKKYVNGLINEVENDTEVCRCRIIEEREDGKIRKIEVIIEAEVKKDGV